MQALASAPTPSRRDEHPATHTSTLPPHLHCARCSGDWEARGGMAVEVGEVGCPLTSAWTHRKCPSWAPWGFSLPGSLIAPPEPPSPCTSQSPAPLPRLEAGGVGGLLS